MKGPALRPWALLLAAFYELGPCTVYLAREWLEARTDDRWKLASATAYSRALPELLGSSYLRAAEEAGTYEVTDAGRLAFAELRGLTALTLGLTTHN